MAQGSGFRVQGSGFRVQGSVFRAQGLERIPGAKYPRYSPTERSQEEGGSYERGTPVPGAVRTKRHMWHRQPAMHSHTAPVGISVRGTSKNLGVYIRVPDLLYGLWSKMTYLGQCGQRGAASTQAFPQTPCTSTPAPESCFLISVVPL